VFVTAAGNSGTNDSNVPFYPASYHLPNEIAVAAVNQAGGLASFSNFGVGSVALAAPGVNILSTVPHGYAYMSGTSMATPYVSGVVALVAGLHPADTAAQLVQQVLSTTKPLPELAGKVTTGGIVDAARAVGIGRQGTNTAQRVHAAAFIAPSHAAGAFSVGTTSARRLSAAHGRAPQMASLLPSAPPGPRTSALYHPRAYWGWPNS
jgi:subtilisin family serine protease